MFTEGPLNVSRDERVHNRGPDMTLAFDISADLSELGRTSVAVICAGVKSILDIHKTLEVLETQGVTVTTVGKTRAFPAFYTPDSGFSVSMFCFV